jgi:hypothetical protein
VTASIKAPLESSRRNEVDDRGDHERRSLKLDRIDDRQSLPASALAKIIGLPAAQDVAHRRQTNDQQEARLARFFACDGRCNERTGRWLSFHGACGVRRSRCIHWQRSLARPAESETLTRPARNYPRTMFNLGENLHSHVTRLSLWGPWRSEPPLERGRP